MTPMMFPAGAPAPVGPMKTGELVPGVPQGVPGIGRGSPDDDGLDAFDVALLAVLEAALLSEIDGQTVPEPVRQAADTPEGGLTALWLHAAGEGAEPKAQDLDLVPTEVGGSDQTPSTDEAAATIAALALVPQQSQGPVPSLRSEGATSPAAEGVDEATPRPVAQDRDERLVTQMTTVPTPRGQRAAGGVEVAVTPTLTSIDVPSEGIAASRIADIPADVPDETDAVGRGVTALPPDERQLTESASRTSYAWRSAGTSGSKAFGAGSSVEPSKGPEVGLPDVVTRGAQTTIAQASAPAPTLEGGSASSAAPRAEDQESPAARILAEMLAVTAASGDQGESGPSSGHSPHDQQQHGHELTASGWLRRASSLESRLAPPVTFSLSGPTPTASHVPTGSVARAAHVTFEMPAPAENLSRLVQSIRVQARDSVSQASVRLNPEHLGEVTISVRVENGTVNAVVRAEAGDVRQWLRGQEESIRAALAEQGLTLDELVVEQDGERHQQHQEPQGQPRRPRAGGRRATTSSFEVTA